MNPAEPVSLETAIARHLAHLRALGYTPATLTGRAWHLALFRAWAEERGMSALADVTPELVARYQRHMAQHRKEDGQPLTSRTQRTRLASLRMFGRWVQSERLLAADPVAALVMPRVGQPLPKAWLSAAQVETVLALPNLGGRRPAAGLRDRAILETLYSTGLRRMELTRLAVPDVDFAAGAVLVRQGKGRKDRVVPIGERALAWIEKYLADARPILARRTGNDGAPRDAAGIAGCRVQDPAPLFVTEQGAPLTVSYLSAMVTRYVTRAGLGKAGSCHLFRHTCATLMLDGGADIRHVQEQLGHACLQTTQIYTHVSIRRLKEVHAATHPGAKLSPRSTGSPQARPSPEAAP
jgi:integrase/recombinase XerD